MTDNRMTRLPPEPSMPISASATILIVIVGLVVANVFLVPLLFRAFITSSAPSTHPVGLILMLPVLFLVVGGSFAIGSNVVNSQVAKHDATVAAWKQSVAAEHFRIAEAERAAAIAAQQRAYQTAALDREHAQLRAEIDTLEQRARALGLPR